MAAIFSDWADGHVSSKELELLRACLNSSSTLFSSSDKMMDHEEVKKLALEAHQELQNEFVQKKLDFK